MSNFTTIKLTKEQAEEIDEIITLLLRFGANTPEIQKEVLAIRKETRGINRKAVILVAVRVLKILIKKVGS